jgi:hypothetical protein
MEYNGSGRLAKAQGATATGLTVNEQYELLKEKIYKLDGVGP